MYTFGNGLHGKLGNGRSDDHNVSIPTQIQGFANVKQVSGESYITAFVTEDGLVYTFGYGVHGTLGDGRSDPHTVSIPATNLFNVINP